MVCCSPMQKARARHSTPQTALMPSCLGMRRDFHKRWEIVRAVDTVNSVTPSDQGNAMRFTLTGTIVLAATLVGSAGADDFELYYGLLHAHTHFSDGEGTPEEAYAMAEDAGLDFFALTEHNHASAGGDDGISLTPALYERLINAAGAATRNGEFVALYGQEVSSISKGNHVNVFNSNSVVDIANGDFRDLYERYLQEHPETALVQFNHPNVRKDLSSRTRRRERHNDYGIDDYFQDFDALVAAADHHVALIEMIIGPAFNTNDSFQHRDGYHEEDYLFYLNKGFHIAPSVGQDNHRRNWGTSTAARLGAWAEELSPRAIYTALRSMRTFASEDRNARVHLRVDDETWMGATHRVAADATVSVALHFSDPDEPGADYVARLYVDDGVGGNEAVIVDISDAVESDSPLLFEVDPSMGGYLFAKLSQRSDLEADPDDIWTAPVWFAPPEDPDPGTEHGDTDVVDWHDAADFMGQEKVVAGTIVDSFHNNTALFLNFDPDFRNTLTVVVFSNDFPGFGGADALESQMLGKKIRVTGEISNYRGRPQIIVNSPNQIEVDQ